MKPQSYLNKDSHDFGDVFYNEIHNVAIYYTGEELLSSNNFIPSCGGCTTVLYNPNNKILVISLRMDSHGTKTANVTCNLPKGQEIIQLTANVK